ncbi:MAG: leucyl aminopeptidase [Pirellulales bacterium]
MNVCPLQQPISEVEADAIVIVLNQDEPLAGAAQQVDESTGGVITRLRETDEVGDKSLDVTPILAPNGVAARQIVCVGLGDRGQIDVGVTFRAFAAAARKLSSKRRSSVVFCPDPQWSAEMIESAVAGVVVGCVGQDLYRGDKKSFVFEQIFVAADGSLLDSGRRIGESINLTRRLVNEPADRMYPESFAAESRRVADDFSLQIDVWGQARLEEERCGSLLAVAKGSSREPQLVILRYRGAAEDAPELALVGKGVTFDSGGLSLKPSESMKAMKCDMAGAATVLGAIQAIAALGLPINVTGYMGLVENMTGPAAYKLGDVLTARNGTTIEIHNTDAEGRLVLADVLAVAVDQGAEAIIDLATLTGACVVALGENVAGVMTNNQEWCDVVMDSADAVGEPVWQLPMFDEFGEQIKSKVADIKNTGEGRWGGAMTAAKLLERFVGDVPWTHIDIAGPAFADKPLPWLAGGGTGALVRTLVEIARQQA